MVEITDALGRSFKTLRVSLVNSCNLGCVYCSTGNNMHQHEEMAAGNTLTAGELLATIRNLHQLLQLKTIRLTGGEPLLYQSIVEVIQGITAMGINDIKLTTNGYLLRKYASDMRGAGLTSLNVSLDAMDEASFFVMTRRNNFARVLDGIEAAIEAGFDVKLNSVIMKGINEQEVLPLMEFAFQKNLKIRFLEVMAMGHLYHEPEKYLYTQEAILQQVMTKYEITRLPRSANATANYWQTNEGYEFGIIANESEPFCADCNRLRLDSHGNIFGCLSDDHPISVRNVGAPEILRSKLHEALHQKQPVRFKGSEMSMLDIGG